MKSENKPTKDYVLMLLHWGLMLIICFGSVFIQYLFVSYTKNKEGAIINGTEIYKINYIVYIIGVVVGVIGFIGLWIALLHKDWMKIAGLSFKWRFLCIITQIIAAVCSLAIAGVAIIFSASFGHVKWYDIVCDPGTLCTVSFFMFAAMMIIFLIYEEVARPFSKKAKDNDDHDDHKQKSIVDSVGEYSEED